MYAFINGIQADISDFIEDLLRRYLLPEMEKRDKENKGILPRVPPKLKEMVERDNDDSDPAVFERIIKAVRDHSIEIKITSLLEYYDRVDAESSSFLSMGSSFDEDELKYWLRRLLDKTGWETKHPLLRALMRGVGIYYRVRLFNYFMKVG